MMMDSDRELLELAAKAAGITLAFSSVGDISPRRADTWDSWNPLTDDGDALRLATDLALNVFHTMGNCYALESDCDNSYEQVVSYRDCKDKYEATRRCITRAAADIGRQGKD